jgi:hypothetical protein
MLVAASALGLQQEVAMAEEARYYVLVTTEVTT